MHRGSVNLYVHWQWERVCVHKSCCPELLESSAAMTRPGVVRTQTQRSLCSTELVYVLHSSHDA